MYNFNQEEGLIPCEHTILEEEATSTAGNAYWSRIIIDRLGIKQVHVVTSGFHIQRSKQIFEKVKFIYKP
jgi:uncharacterized SAM-binding protein YcdF (DUF218 family)